MNNLSSQFGSWAIITGASSGIGKEFAHQVAAQGMHVILIARRKIALQELATILVNRYQIKIRHASIDLSQPLAITQLQEIVGDLDIGLFISNAGAAHMGAFHKIQMETFEQMVQLNVTAHMKLSHWFTSRCLTSSRKGGILFVSSTVAYQGIPYAANYAAAKAYILNLGEALHYELKSKNIHVSVLLPGPTDAPGLTERTDANMVDHLPMTPQAVDQLVTEGLHAISRNKSTHIGGRKNRILTHFMSFLMTRKFRSEFWGKMMYKMVLLK